MFSRFQILEFWSSCKIATARKAMASDTAEKIFSFRERFYDEVEAQTRVPWWVIGAIDFREESFNHNGYLGNGDPLSRKTVHVPRGRGPFKTWHEGAIDSIHISGWDRLPAAGHWDIVTALLKTEAYNGQGYAHMGLRSPYVWSGTNMQERGMYVSDGHFDANAWDTRIGCAAIFLALRDIGVDLNER